MRNPHRHENFKDKQNEVCMSFYIRKKGIGVWNFKGKGCNSEDEIE